LSAGDVVHPKPFHQQDGLHLNYPFEGNRTDQDFAGWACQQGRKRKRGNSVGNVAQLEMGKAMKDGCTPINGAIKN